MVFSLYSTMYPPPKLDYVEASVLKDSLKAREGIEIGANMFLM